MKKNIYPLNPTLGVVIPTKNRPDDLVRAVVSVIEQSRRPDEIIIIDQSKFDSAKGLVDKLLKSYQDIKQIYILNEWLSGLTAAKNLATSISRSDILLFIDDDIVLEPDFISLILDVYIKYPDLSGVGGQIKLPNGRSSVLRRLIATFFQIGIFRDKRALLQAGYFNSFEMVPTRILSGGLSSLRRNVFNIIKFDEQLLGASPIEDIDFYFSASKKFKFALAPKACALHNVSMVNRSGLKKTFELKCFGFCYIFLKYAKKSPFNVFAFLWRNVGMFFDAVLQVLKYKSLDPLLGLVKAWEDFLVKKYEKII